MKLGLKFPERLAGVLYPVREALEDLIIGIEKGWSQEHLGTGQHNAITALSIGHPTPAETSVLALTSGLELRQGPASLSRAFVSNSADPSVLTPPQITATVDDYSPAGLDQALVVRLNVDTNRTIAGLRRPQPSQARLYWLVNTTTAVITLAHEATSSTAANRFYAPGAVNYYLPAYGAVAVVYDPVTLRWRVIDSSAPNWYTDGSGNTSYGATNAGNNGFLATLTLSGAGIQNTLQVKNTQAEAANVGTRVGSLGAANWLGAVDFQFEDAGGNARMLLSTGVGGGLTEQFRLTSAGLGKLRGRLQLGGTAIVASDWALDASWGANATVSTVSGTDSRGTVTVLTSALDTPTANPFLTLTFKNGTWTTAPFAVATLNRLGSGLTGPVECNTTATTLVLEYIGTPTPLVANTYVFNYLVIG